MLEWLFGGPPYQNLDDDNRSVQSKDMDFLQFSTCGAMTNAASVASVTCPGALDRQSSARAIPATLQDIENATELRTYRHRSNGMSPSHSIISKQSQATSPSCSSDNNSMNDSFGADGASNIAGREQDWNTFKKQLEDEDRQRWSKCRILLCISSCLLLMAIIALGINLAKQNQKKRETSAANSISQQDDELSSGIFEQTFSPSDLTTDLPTQEELFSIGNEFDTAAPTAETEPEVMPQDTVAPTMDTPPEDTHEETVAPTVATLPDVVFQDDLDENGYDYTANTDYLVGVYYYPWHGSTFHNGDGYLRKELIPPQQPTLGEYDDSRPEVIAQHMLWFRKANIGLLVTSWWGPNRLEDSNTKDVIMEHEDIGNLKIALHYETTSRIRGDDMTNARSDIIYMCEHYFDHPNYYRIKGRPVLVIYITRRLHNNGLLEQALLTMRSEASKCGHNLYLIGDQVFASAPDPDEPFVPFWYFDAVTNYDVYGSAGQPSPHADRASVDAYYAEQEKWRLQALEENCRYIPPVSPGYNDRAVRLESNHPPLSRRLSATDEEGSLFWYQLTKALPLVDPEVDNMILVNSFNEWHEDTQIEPVIGGAPTDEPLLYTGGLEYTPYGELYLDILQGATTRGQENMFDYFFDRTR
ncbi:glycosyl hydrolase family 99 protein [Nitzschia inconspicua]|uniref:Glycosyl hydrolase family 99 protein n=1 Tax=Nitzschia inconspicua TaxID=303405 RepID=A0A9K3PPI8_9STRA|nr:glycosyl hydrolase family 99 protein [Nitzschia inconspicua]